jgi:16S rRNA (adenine1518-N6/adenine1519-N6)-dimethyltransferase
MRAKKSLGQNFLKSDVALRKIVEAGEIKSDDIILEIGPGKGALTKQLLGSSGQVLAVEKDRELVELLKEKFKKEIEEKKLILINEDILKLRITNYELRNYKIIANIPYNITGAILKKFLTEKPQPERMVLMVQHEVAKRIIAQDGKESILSISVKAYGKPKMIMKVSARYFSPAPKVDSAIIVINDISRKNFLPPSPSQGEGLGVRSMRPGASATPQEGKVDEEKFWEIVKAGFAHKRKKLSSNLKIIFPVQNESLKSMGNKRAEDLSLEGWISLAK